MNKKLLSKKLLMLLFVFLVGMGTAKAAYDFSYTYNGKTLYYKITDGTKHFVRVTYPGTSSTQPWKDYTQPTGAITIPSTVTYNNVTYTVKAIGGYSFSNCTNVTSVTIPNTIIHIGEWAFYYCNNTSFTSITIPTSVKRIDNYAFCSTKLNNFTIPESVEYIGQDAFHTTGWGQSQTGPILYKDGCCLGYKGDKPTGAITITQGTRLIASHCFKECTGLTSVSIPSTVKYICDYAFSGCSSMSAITLPEGVVAIDMYAFNCSALTSFNIPSTVTQISEYAFEGTQWYKNQPNGAVYKDNCLIKWKGTTAPTGTVIINDGTRLIAGMALYFYSNTGITSLVLPSSLLYLGTWACGGLQGLTEIRIMASTPPVWNGVYQFYSQYDSYYEAYNPFYNVSRTTQVVVPCGAQSSYQSAPIWKEFTNYQSSDYTVTVEKTTGGNASGGGDFCSGSTCTLTATPSTGYDFIKWTKNDSQVSTNQTYSFSVYETSTYKAWFAKKTYTVSASASPSSGGTITGSGTYDHGTNCTLTATPATGYTFTNWKKGSEVVSTSASYSFNVTANATYTATFTPINYSVTVSADPTTGGTVSGGGTYAYGTNCTVTATPASGNSFAKWTKNGVVVSTNPSYTFQVTGETSLVAHFGNYAVFTCSSFGNNRWVNFSPGNLQYQPSTQTWRFASNQTDYVGYVDHDAYYGNNDGWIDLFGWGTSGVDHGAVCYNPTSTSTTNSDYYAYGDPSKNLNYYTPPRADWGYNAISNGGNTINQWRTPTQSQWNYILNQRSTRTGYRYAKATVNNVKGIIILPDNWQTSYQSLSNPNTPDAAYSSNIISSSQWTNMELYGAVFLPASGYREGWTYSPANQLGNGYWSATHKEDFSAYFLAMGEDYLQADYDRSREIGLPVRLIRQDQGTKYLIDATPNTSDGGSVLYSDSYPVGSYCSLLAINKVGYSFTNWTEGNNVVSTNSTYGFVVTGARTLVANFTVATYTVTLYKNGGTINSGNVTSYTYGVGATLPTNVTRTGYTFGGWYTNSSFTGSAVTSISTTATGNKTYYAKWTANTYTVTLNTNGGTINSGNVTQYTYGVGATLPTNVTRTGYTFGGWYANSNLTGSAVTSISTTATGNKIYYAKWTANTYTVTLNTNGGTINSGNVTSYTYGVGATLPTNVTKTGYTFGGWYDNPFSQEGPAITSISTTETGDKDYVAKWIINSYNIVATANPPAGGSVTGAGNYNYNTTCTLTATPNTYYTFVNWTKNSNVVSTNATYSFTVTQADAYVANFALAGRHFITAGNWSNTANWVGNALPGTSDDVTIHANCNLNQNATVSSLTIDGGVLTIKSGYILKVTGTLTNATAANLVVEDGGQLITNNAVAVTMQKRITAATHWGDQTTPYTPDGWYFIATPMSSITVESAATNLHTYSVSGYDYDLYQFNQAADRKEWQNYKTMEGANHANFSTLDNGHGYLFASNTSFTLSFAGTLVNNPTAITLKNEGNTYELAGYNLIGNPYPCKATLSVATMPFYRLQNGSEVVYPTAAGSIIDPLEGILVHVDANTEITFNKVEPSNAIAPNNSGLNISLNTATRNPRTVDHAILSFGTSGDLPKFYFNDTEATISLLQEKNEFAVAHSSAQGEMPLNFKARTNGTYTITINPEDIEVYYLHLIDNITGADIDLLQTPSYTFTARNDDYTSRFRLVFSAKSSGEENGDDDFAFISNGNIIVAGEGTLQVFDVTGRMISSNSVSRNISTNGLSAGVYMLRLVNNDNVKVQKIVVR